MRKNLVLTRLEIKNETSDVINVKNILFYNLHFLPSYFFRLTRFISIISAFLILMIILSKNRGGKVIL